MFVAFKAVAELPQAARIRAPAAKAEPMAVRRLTFGIILRVGVSCCSVTSTPPGHRVYGRPPKRDCPGAQTGQIPKLRGVVPSVSFSVSGREGQAHEGQATVALGSQRTGKLTDEAMKHIS